MVEAPFIIVPIIFVTVASLMCILFWCCVRKTQAQMKTLKGQADHIYKISHGQASIPREYVTMIPALGSELHWFVTNLCRRTWEAKNYQNDNVKRLKLPSDVSATVGCVGFVQCKKPRRWLRQNAATVQDPRGAAIIT